MPRFHYRAIDQLNRRVKGELEAANLLDLEQRLRGLGLALIDGHEQRTRLRAPARLPRRELIQLCFQLEQLARAGVPLAEGLSDLRDTIDHGRLRDTLGALTESIRGGRSLSQAFAEQPGFPAVFCSLIRVGELTGELPKVVAQLAEAMKREDEFANHARRLSLYPLMLLGSIGLALLLCLALLVPQLASLFRSLGQDLPLHTRVLVAASNGAVQYGHWALLTLAALSLAVVFQVKHNAAWARMFDRFMLVLPVIGAVLHKIMLARFASLLGLMYAAGIPLTEALRALRDTTANRLMQAAIDHSLERIHHGQTLSAALAETALFPPLVIRMLRMGEATGSLGSALTNITEFFEREVKETVARAQAVTGPLLTLGLGAVLAWVMVSVLGPVYDLLTKIKF
jgi:type IV pilus assembly protein PilC